MDAAKKKALFRSKLNAQKKEKRIDSPLVRYNESDQPVCRVCDVLLKSESNWDAHQASRKHHETISNIKANAAGLSRINKEKDKAPEKFPKPESAHSSHMQSTKMEREKTEIAKPQSLSVLPPDFFDNNENTKSKTGKDSVKLVEPKPQKKLASSQTQMETVDIDTKIEVEKSTETNTDSETKLGKRALPEGFFDDKEADLRARGIKLVKPDVKDEYKEFEKLIQEDLQEVDDRLEEEEFDAAETIEEAESVEQKSCREKVEMLRKKKMELEAVRSAKRIKASDKAVNTVSKLEESSSDDDSEGDFAVDWRAQHL